MRQRRWTEKQLRLTVINSFSIRRVLNTLGLKAAGGNYAQIHKYLQELKIDTSHFKGQGWSKGLVGIGIPRFKLEEILINGSSFQSYKLKKRQFEVGRSEERRV